MKKIFQPANVWIVVCAILVFTIIATAGSCGPPPEAGPTKNYDISPNRGIDCEAGVVCYYRSSCLPISETLLRMEIVCPYGASW